MMMHVYNTPAVIRLMQAGGWGEEEINGVVQNLASNAVASYLSKEAGMPANAASMCKYGLRLPKGTTEVTTFTYRSPTNYEVIICTEDDPDETAKKFLGRQIFYPTQAGHTRMNHPNPA